MATARRLLCRPSSLLVIYLSAMCAVQLSVSTGGLVRWSDYSVLVPLVAAALLPVRRTLFIGVATLAASVAVYGLAIHGVSEGGRAVVISAAALSFGLSLVTCRTRLSLQRPHCTRAEQPVVSVDSPGTGSEARHTADGAPGDAPSCSVPDEPPPALPQPAALELVGSCTADNGTAMPKAHWLDAIPLSGARVALVAGSVADHGSSTPKVAAELRAAVRTLADIDLQPEELLTHLEDVLTRLRPQQDVVRHRMVQHRMVRHEAVQHDESAAGTIARCLYAVYDPVSARCTLASAGYPAPTVIRPDGLASAVEIPAGPPLGHGRPPAESTEVALPEGSVLLLHAHTPGTPDLAAWTGGTAPPEAVRSQRCLNAICHCALDALVSGGRYVHAGVLAARTHAFDGSNVGTWELSADVAAVSQARQHISGKLAAWGLEDAAPTMELIASELVTNAIRHAHPPVRLRLILHGAGLTCEVSDGSSTSPHLRRARTFDEGGRGLFIVAQLTRRWGTRHNSHGKTIWAEEQLPTSEEARNDHHNTSAGLGA
ncbi:ATP-binding SpoIIE family protein phosphatase [Streptomyces sp. NRRL S-813]|uniref:ATP-binding SpoIIE family protein phosphatase n=1 Tax=Streptomyces sp. NRRL S-813 TaxID=1463919 RepID=UPI00099B4B1C|nr:ATP-binding SpoIIE family protein phosphatase [Streptomyces sp. NRRL S-813]